MYTLSYLSTNTHIHTHTHIPTYPQTHADILKKLSIVVSCRDCLLRVTEMYAVTGEVIILRYLLEASVSNIYSDSLGASIQRIPLNIDQMTDEQVSARVPRALVY